MPKEQFSSPPGHAGAISVEGIVFAKKLVQFDEIVIVDQDGNVMERRKRDGRVDPRVVLWEIDQFLTRMQREGRKVERICLGRELLMGILEFLFGPQFFKWKKQFGDLPESAAFRAKYAGLMLVYEPGLKRGQVVVFAKDVRQIGKVLDAISKKVASNNKGQGVDQQNNSHAMRLNLS